MDPVEALRQSDGPRELPADVLAGIEKRMYDAFDEAASEIGSDGAMSEVALVPDATRSRRVPRAGLVAVAAVMILVAATALALWVDPAADQEVATTADTSARSENSGGAGEVVVATPTEPPLLLAEAIDTYCGSVRADIDSISWRGEAILRTWPLIEDQHAELQAVVERAIRELPDANGLSPTPAVLQETGQTLAEIASRMTGYERAFVNNRWETIAADIPDELSNLDDVLTRLAVLGAPSCSR